MMTDLCRPRKWKSEEWLWAPISECYTLDSETLGYWEIQLDNARKRNGGLTLLEQVWLKIEMLVARNFLYDARRTTGTGPKMGKIHCFTKDSKDLLDVFQAARVIRQFVYYPGILQYFKESDDGVIPNDLKGKGRTAVFQHRKFRNSTAGGFFIRCSRTWFPCVNETQIIEPDVRPCNLPKRSPQELYVKPCRKDRRMIGKKNVIIQSL